MRNCVVSELLLPLRWSREQLVNAAEVAVGAVVDFERGARRPYKRTLTDIRRALEDAGVFFIDEDEELGPGIRLKKPRVRKQD